MKFIVIVAQLKRTIMKKNTHKENKQLEYQNMLLNKHCDLMYVHVIVK